jgi:hypothetical protein
MASIPSLQDLCADRWWGGKGGLTVRKRARLLLHHPERAASTTTSRHQTGRLVFGDMWREASGAERTDEMAIICTVFWPLLSDTFSPSRMDKAGVHDALPVKR